MTGGVASVSVTNCLFDEFDVAFQVRNRLFVAPFYPKTEHLPRQARDKHNKTGKPRSITRMFSRSHPAPSAGLASRATL